MPARWSYVDAEDQTFEVVTAVSDCSSEDEYQELHPQDPRGGLSHRSDSSSYLPDTLEANLKKRG